MHKNGTCMTSMFIIVIIVSVPQVSLAWDYKSSPIKKSAHILMALRPHLTTEGLRILQLPFSSCAEGAWNLTALEWVLAPALSACCWLLPTYCPHYLLGSDPTAAALSSPQRSGSLASLPSPGPWCCQYWGGPLLLLTELDLWGWGCTMSSTARRALVMLGLSLCQFSQETMLVQVSWK